MTYEYSDLAEDSRDIELTDCTECGSDRTSYSNCIDGVEVRKCHDCNNYFGVQ